MSGQLIALSPCMVGIDVGKNSFYVVGGPIVLAKGCDRCRAI